MKIPGRKTSSAYELYGFIPQVSNGRHTAICKSCNRVLQNTAAARLEKHRNTCVAARAKRESVPLANSDTYSLCLESKKQSSSTDEVDQQNDNYNCSVKTEHSNMEFENSNINDNTNYEESVEVRTTKRSNPRISAQEKRRSAEPNNLTCDYDENPIMSPTTVTHSHQIDPFESYQETIFNNLELDMHEDIEEINDEELMNIENEIDVIQNLMPRSKVSMQLQEEYTKAETEYYRSKAAYFTKLTENSKIKRTLMLLESRKLQLEIENLTHRS